MKTNVMLQSKSREIMGYPVSVMSRDGYVCITEATDAMNAKREKNGLKKRFISDIVDTNLFRERCYELCSKLDDNRLWVKGKDNYREEISKIKSIRDLSKLKLAYRRGKGADQKWYVNPYLFIMIALEMDPEVYAEVVIWLQDGFINARNEAGDAYIKMSSAVRSIVKCNNEEFRDLISGVSKAINYIVFNRHEEGIRNFADKDELRAILNLENHIIQCIDDGMISSYDDLIDMLRKRWKRNWGNPIDRALPYRLGV